MLKVNQYLQQHQSHIAEIFNGMAKQNEIPATNVFSFLQLIFQLESIEILVNQKDYFQDDENRSHMQKLIEQYYKTTQDGKQSKFYLYRINFTYQEVVHLLDFWMKTEKKIEVIYKQQQQKSPEKLPNQEQKGNQNDLRQSSILDNQFLVQQHRLPLIIEGYERQISKYQEIILQHHENSAEAQLYRSKIQQLTTKIQFLKAKLQKNQDPKQLKNYSGRRSSLNEEYSKTEEATSKKALSPLKKQINFKALFDFYAKQTHLTGIKATFDRIQHESQTINYQKLVHFLKEYEIFPSNLKDQKKLHNLYVRNCSDTRDLHYEDFVNFLEKLPEIVVQLPEASIESKKDIMMAKLSSKNQKNKLLNNPFHSLEKNDFRIDPKDIRYEFKLKPIKGKLEEGIINELELRKKSKQENKLQVSKEKEQMKIKRLKKLKSIDPYNPLVVKNSKLFQQKSIIELEPIATLENMQKYRDNNFNMKEYFGFSDVDQDLMKQFANKEDINKRVKFMQKQELQKMNNLMSSIIDRSNAKLQKLGLSPSKRYNSSKNT